MLLKYIVLFFGIFIGSLATSAEGTLPSAATVRFKRENPSCSSYIVRTYPKPTEPIWIASLKMNKIAGGIVGTLNVTFDAVSYFQVIPKVSKKFDIVNQLGQSLIVNIQKNVIRIRVKVFQNRKVPNLLSIHFNGIIICQNPDPTEIMKLFVTNRQGETDEKSKIIEKCGKRRIEHAGLVTFGTDVRPGDFPWHAAVYHKSGLRKIYKCGGTIINTYTVLTAAHCVYESFSLMAPERIIVRIGKYYLHKIDHFAREREVIRIIPHPAYNTSLLTDDIALLRLSRKIIYSDYIQPICLWDPNLSYSGNGVSVGWGYTENDMLSDALRFVELPIVPSMTCLISDRNFFGTFLTDNSFCAGYLNGTNVCTGDSGGALVFRDDDKVWRIRGIISLSTRRMNIEICNPKHYVIFTDVAKYLSWIKQESSQ